MQADRVCEGRHAVLASHGTYIAFTRNASLSIVNIKSRSERCVSAQTPLSSGNTLSLQWSPDGSQILAVHSAGIQVYDSEHGGERISLENGSGSLGSIASADFIGNHHLLLAWEFGRTKLFHMNSGKAIDLPDLKTSCDGSAWQIRPGNASPSLFALLSRTATGDQLVLQFSSLTHTLPPVRLPTVDVQHITWSPDGRWLAIIDVPSATPNLYIYTPDGHRFRSYPAAKATESGLAIKSIAWSPDARYLALAKYDGQIELLNTRTFSAIALIEHNTTINQTSLATSEKALIWQEQVSATGEHSYTLQAQPVSPPLSKPKADPDLRDLGTAELAFSSDGQYLATRDCRMLNTVWIWNTITLVPHAVNIQHNDVRSLQWHPSQPEVLLIDCAGGFAHVFDVSSAQPPVALPTRMRPRARLSWMRPDTNTSPIIAVLEKTRFRPMFIKGHLPHDATRSRTSFDASTDDNIMPFDEGASEDSLFDVLSGRKPLPPKTEPSFMERIDFDMEDEDTINGGALEDTFREKKAAVQVQPVEVDPLDDSQIF